MNRDVIEILTRRAREQGLDLRGAKVRRTSSRFCLGVEHGDYNGTELFGVGTDRFIWLAYKPNGTDRMRLFSDNFPDDGLIEFTPGRVPEPRSPGIAETWARFPFGVDHVLRRRGIALTRGVDAVIHGNIPGGGMSRSASLTLNLITSLLDVEGVEIDEPMEIVDLAQAVENDYIGSPCGNLDPIMILFAKAGFGTHYRPADRTVRYVPLGKKAIDFRIVSLDTGTVRPGLEKSTYRIRRAQCEELVELAGAEFGIAALADVKEEALYRGIVDRFQATRPELCARLTYIFHAQHRFETMLAAWKRGDLETVGAVFRADGIGLRDDYAISGPELETMCDIARSVPGVLGERMLGGGDKGAAGALVKGACVEALKEAVDTGYPRSHPECRERYALHVCNIVDGVEVYYGVMP
jgi:galactokinase